MIRWPTVRAMLALLGALAGTSRLQAQERAPAAEPEPWNTVTVSIGRSHDEFEDGVETVIRAIGTDYMRRIGGKWEAGVQFDLDLDPVGGGAQAFLVTPVVAYNITSRWPVFVGAGVAFEEDHTQAFGRVGSEFMFPLDHKTRWFLAPGAFLDIASEATPSVMLALGHTF